MKIVEKSFESEGDYKIVIYRRWYKRMISFVSTCYKLITLKMIFPRL